MADAEARERAPDPILREALHAARADTKGTRRLRWESWLEALADALAASEARVAALEQREKDVVGALERLANGDDFAVPDPDGALAYSLSKELQARQAYARAVLSARPTEETA